MNKTVLLLVVVLAGCRLTDPVFVFKDLAATEPPFDDASLVFGTVEIEGGFFSPGDVDYVVFRRLAPDGSGERYYSASERVLFRAFSRRQLKDGNFLLYLPPGAYELFYMESGNTIWRVSEALSVASRFHVTRPGVYDIGILHAKPDGGGTYSVELLPPRASAERTEILRSAIEGTSWVELALSPPSKAAGRRP